MRRTTMRAQKDVELIAATAKVKTVGNYVHPSVPVSNDEENNEIIRTWVPEGVTVEKKECLSHHEVLYRLGGYDPDRGVKVVGHRGYCLTGMGLFLNRRYFHMPWASS